MTLSLDTASPRSRAVPPPLPLFHPQTMLARRARCRSGPAGRVRRGVYASASLWWALPPWERYLARVHAVGDDASGAWSSASSPQPRCARPAVFGEPLEVHVLDSSSNRHARLSGGMRLHTTLGRSRDRRGRRPPRHVRRRDRDRSAHAPRHGAIGLAVADAALRADPLLTVRGSRARTNERRRTVAARRQGALGAASRDGRGRDRPGVRQSRRHRVAGFRRARAPGRSSRTDRGRTDRVDMLVEREAVPRRRGRRRSQIRRSARATRARRSAKERDRDAAAPRQHVAAIRVTGAGATLAEVAPAARSPVRATGLRPIGPEVVRSSYARTTRLPRRCLRPCHGAPAPRDCTRVAETEGRARNVSASGCSLAVWAAAGQRQAKASIGGHAHTRLRSP